MAHEASTAAQLIAQLERVAARPDVWKELDPTRCGIDPARQEQRFQALRETLTGARLAAFQEAMAAAGPIRSGARTDRGEDRSALGQFDYALIAELLWNEISEDDQRDLTSPWVYAIHFAQVLTPLRTYSADQGGQMVGDLLTDQEMDRLEKRIHHGEGNPVAMLVQRPWGWLRVDAARGKLTYSIHPDTVPVRLAARIPATSPHDALMSPLSMLGMGVGVLVMLFLQTLGWTPLAINLTLAVAIALAPQLAGTTINQHVRTHATRLLDPASPLAMVLVMEQQGRDAGLVDQLRHQGWTLDDFDRQDIPALLALASDVLHTADTLHITEARAEIPALLAHCTTAVDCRAAHDTLQRLHQDMRPAITAAQDHEDLVEAPHVQALAELDHEREELATARATASLEATRQAITRETQLHQALVNEHDADNA